MSMDKLICKELSTVPAPKLQARLHKFLADVVCDVFWTHGDSNSAVRDHVIQSKLTNPLQWMLFGGDPVVVAATFEGQSSATNYCGKVFKSGEPTYFCKDCQTDPTCCLCMECFEHGDHKNHKYRLFASGGGGCCDCGDPEAWTSGVYCDLHQPTQGSDQEVDPTENLSPDLLERSQEFFLGLLWYCVTMLTSTESTSLPPHLLVLQSADKLETHDDSYVSFLYNDEVHSYQQVISTLTNIGLTHTEAMTLATTVDRKGRAVTKCGDQAVCEELNRKINANMEPPLRVEMFHKVVVAHQECAITLLAFIRELVEKAASFRRIVSQALADCNQTGPSKSVLDNFFIKDSSLWISARVSWHRLVMSSIFMDPVYKKQLAIILTSNYTIMQKNFVEDSHQHDISASNLTVQIFTVPSLSRMLVLEHGVLRVILRTLQNILHPCRDLRSGTLQLSSDNYNHNRVYYVIADLRYILHHKPDQWTPELRRQVLWAYEELLELMSWLQNADAVKRQRYHHTEREKTWEHCFNISISLQPAVRLFVEWCISDAVVLRDAIAATWKKHSEVAMVQKMKLKSHKIDSKSVDLIVFDVYRDSISVHMPLPRLISALLAGAHRHNLTIDQLLQISPTDVRTQLVLMEHCCRSLVMAVQVMAGMWKRNGYSVVNQIINYQYHNSKESMYDKDILMLQCMATLLDPSIFFYALLYKFRLENWLTSPDSNFSRRGEAADDALSFFISEAEEFLFLILTIYAERFVCGVGEGVTNRLKLRREVIHRLYISSLSHSELMKHFRFIEDENELDKVISEVAIQQRRQGSAGKAVFELKPECEVECTPFFYHYTRPDHSKAEEIRRKKLKSSGERANLLPELPQFTAPYQGVLRLAQCPVLHQLLQGVIQQAATPNSRLWSDKLLHEALYMCAIILTEEDSTQPGSLAKMAASGKYVFLQHLETLLISQRAEEHRPLLQWCVHHIRSTQKEGSDDEHMETDLPHQSALSTESSPSSLQSVVEERRHKAQVNRDKLMRQISDMQKAFLEKHKKELDEVDYAAETTMPIGPGLNVVRHECAVGVASLVNHTPSPLSVTCIVCQEETKDFANQDKTFVQAVCVQRSSVLCKKDRANKPLDKLLNYSEVDLIQALADVEHGVFTSGCGHHMHMDCWIAFLDNKKVEHSREHFFPLPGQSVLWSGGEFLCPLCQCFGNSVLPMLPQVGQLSVLGHSAEPCKSVSMQEWRTMVSLALDLATGDADAAAGSSVDPSFLDMLEAFFPTYKRPELAENKGGEVLANMQDEFSRSVLLHTYGVGSDQSDHRLGLAQWRNCAYTIASLEYNARSQDKFILLADTLSPRQLNCVRSLVRLGSEPSVRPSLEEQIKHIKYLTSTFLLAGPGVADQPCHLDIDCFQMLINLHFSISTLFLSVSSARGRHTPLVNDVIILPLMGLTDAHLIKLTAAAHVLQFLLTFSPPQEDVPDDGSNRSDLSDGLGLQQLWIRYRTIARLSCESPPSPNDLSVRVRQHMYSFLQCAALFFNCLSGVDLIHSSATTATYYDDLCKYLGLPSDLHLLFEDGAGGVLEDSSVPRMISSIAEWWCSHPKIPDLIASCKILPVLREPRLLIDLPQSYSTLVKQAVSFQCPTLLPNEGQASMLCLVCGEMLCTNSYCCAKSLPLKDEMSVTLGGFCQHAQRCGAGIGMALWILESYVVLLDATNASHVQGCTLTPPYFDEYGEADPGLRRGNPMHYSKQAHDELKQVWYHHHVPERVRKEMESNRGLMRIRWATM